DTTQDVAELLSKSSAAQTSVAGIVATWRTLQQHRPLFTAVDSLVEYRHAPTQASTNVNLRVALYPKLETSFRGPQDAIARVLSQCWSLLEVRWRQEASQLIDHEEREAGDKSKTTASTDEERQLQSLEEFVALRYVAFIRGVLGHLRHVMIFLALSFSLVLISLNISSFEPHEWLL